MNRIEFIEEHKKKLRKLPFDEIKEAVDYYEGYFDDAGEENEQTVISELGSPSAIASQIIASFAIKEADTEGSGKKKWRTTWLVILALFATPIAVPLAISAGVLALVLIITMSAVIITLFASGIAIFAAGIASIVAGVLVAFQSFPTTLLYVGVGLMLSGAGAAMFIATMKLSKICFSWLTKKIGGFILRRKAK